jgi:hypothetical protein
MLIDFIIIIIKIGAGFQRNFQCYFVNAVRGLPHNAVSKCRVGCLMNWKGFGRNGSCPNPGSFIEELRETQKASFMTAVVPA